ncbi:hypothetical protein BC830DRAFT_182520 [Chytriomyces sp. MP71]|nr:hypothetical protein BC830DRAFT_182520 [Chytriomyces sp. MP71]
MQVELSLPFTTRGKQRVQMSQRKGTVDSTGSPSACPPHVDEFGFFILPSKTSLSNMLPTPPPAPTEAPTIKRAWTMRRTLTDASRPLDDIPKRSSSAFHLAGPSKTAVDASTAAHATAERLYDAASSSNTKLQDAAEMGSMPQIPSYLRKK